MAIHRYNRWLETLCAAFITTLILTSPAEGQTITSGYPKTFSRTSTSTESDPVVAHTGSGNGNTIIACKSDNSLLVVRVRADDTTLTRSYTEPNGGVCEPKAVKIGPGGYIYIACKVIDGITLQQSTRVLKFPPSLGSAPTAYPVYNPASGPSYPVDIAVDATGNSFVTGVVQGATTGDDIFVVGFDTSGNTCQPIATCVGTGISPGDADKPTGIALDSSGNVEIGASVFAGSTPLFTALKYSTSTGSLLSQRSWIPASSYVPHTSRLYDFAFYNDVLWLPGWVRYYYLVSDMLCAAFASGGSGDIVGPTGTYTNPWGKSNVGDFASAICSGSAGTYAYGVFNELGFVGSTIKHFVVINCVSSAILLQNLTGLSAADMDTLGSNVILAGQTDDPFVANQISIYKCLPTSWSTTYTDSYALKFGKVIANSNGTSFVVASVRNASGDWDLLVIKYNA